MQRHGMTFNFGSAKVCSPAIFETCFFYDLWGGHGGRVVTLSPPTSVAGVRSLSWP